MVYILLGLLYLIVGTIITTIINVFELRKGYETKDTIDDYGYISIIVWPILIVGLVIFGTLWLFRALSKAAALWIMDRLERKNA